MKPYWYLVASIPIIFGSVNLLLLIGRLSGFELFLNYFKHAYNFNTIILPALVLIIGIYGLSLKRRRGGGRWVSLTARLLIVGAICGFGFRIYATSIEPFQLKIREVKISTPKVDRPVKILHMSDIQAGETGPYEESVFARIREINPDLILYTGDFLQPVPPADCESETPKLRALFKTLKPPMGMYGVYGNVDRCFDRSIPVNYGGMNVLVDESASINTEGANIKVFGLAFLWTRVNPKPPDQVMIKNVHDLNQEKIIADWLKAADPKDFTIVLGHYPDYVLTVNGLPIDLCLAGHTHGGQVRIPLLGPVFTASNVPRSWARGFREVGNTRLNVSAGIGTERGGGLPPIRFNCPPEMTLITLEPVK